MVRKPRPPAPTRILAVYATVTGPRTWRSLKLAVDTGATYTMLPPNLLLDIGHDPAAATRRLELSTASGLVVAPLLRVHSLKCQGLAVKGMEVVVHPLPPENPVEGLLGLNFLAHFKPFQVFHQALRPFSV